MITRRSLAVVAALIPLALALPALAGAQKFTPEALAAAQKSGKSILVEVTAPWCPTCKAQKIVLNELYKDPRFANLVTLQVDFDSQKADLKTLKVAQQSTLIVYKGETEMGRSLGETRADAIEALLAKSL